MEQIRKDFEDSGKRKIEIPGWGEGGGVLDVYMTP